MSYKKREHSVITTFQQQEISSMVIPVDTSQKTLLGTYDSSRNQLEYTGEQLDYSYTDLGDQFQMLKEAKQNSTVLQERLDKFNSDQEYINNWNSQQQSNQLDIKIKDEPNGQ